MKKSATELTDKLQEKYDNLKALKEQLESEQDPDQKEKIGKRIIQASGSVDSVLRDMAKSLPPKRLRKAIQQVDSNLDKRLSHILNRPAPHAPIF